jgi:3-phenylpropionate/trans-cinnamate dioxygenase ferredoxin reductase component
MNELYGLLIIGGGPAGLSAARAYREREPSRRVAIVTDENRMPYSRPPLTKELLRGEISKAELPLEEEQWLDEHAINLIAGRAVALDAAERTVDLSGGRRLRYDYCLLATGAEPTRLPVPGADHARVRVIRALDHVEQLLERLTDGARVVVIGSGFIGCEIASSLRARGHVVELVSDEPAPNAARLGDGAAAILAGWLSDDGVQLHFGTPVERIESDGKAATVIAGEQQITGEVIVMATGVAPRLELALQAKAELEDGGIRVDALMRTNVGGLLAAGDVAKADNRAAGRALRVEHWGDALGQGEVAGRTAAGDAAVWDAVPGFWSTIGNRTLKYAAWGDGYEDVRLERDDGGGFTAWYGAGGKVVGVLTHQADDDYERGSALIGEGASWRS